MDLFEAVEPSSVVGFLIEITLKGTLVLALAGLAVAALKSASAAVRHLVWSTALVLLLVLPAFVAFAPSYELAVLPSELGTRSSPDLRSELQVVPRSERSSRHGGRSARSNRTFSGIETAASETIHLEDLSETTAPISHGAESVNMSGPSPKVDWRRALFLLWIMGAALVAFRYALGWLALRRVRFRSIPVSDVGLRLLVKRTASGIGLRRRIRLVWGDVGSMPLTFGCIRPTVLLPEDAREWEADRLIVVLKHELAHVKRRDCLIQAVVYFACTLYWFNPLVWIAASQSHREREMACDDYVLTTGAVRSEYAGHLVEIARSLRGPRMSGVTTIAMARRSELEGRLMAILSANRKRGRATTRGVLATFAVLGCLVMTIAALRPVAMHASAGPDTVESPVEATNDIVLPAPVANLTKSEFGNPEVVSATASIGRYDEEYVAEASLLVEKATETIEASLNRLVPESIKLSASLVAKIDGALDLIAEGGLEIVRSDTIPLEQIKRLRSAGVDVEYIEAMAAVGFDHLTIDQLILLAHADVDADYVTQFRAAGFTDLTADDLIELGFAGVDADDIKVWAELGYRNLSSRELIKLAHADVDAEDVRAFASLGYSGLSPTDLVQMGRAGVGPEFIRAMRDMGLDNLKPRDLIRLSHADVDADFIRQMREAGYEELTADELIGLSHADVDPEFVGRMSELGLTSLSTDDLVQLGRADVDVEFIAELRAAGYQHLAASELVALSHADVDAAFVREMGALGLKNLDVPELIRLGHAGIDASFIREMKDSGFGDLDVEQLIQLSYAGVDPDYASELTRAGLKDLTPMDLVRLSHADIDADMVAELSRSGLKNLSTSDLIQLGFADVDGEYIAELKSVGLTGLSVSDLVTLAFAGVDADDVKDLREIGVKSTDPEVIVKYKYLDIDPEYVDRVRNALERD